MKKISDKTINRLTFYNYILRDLIKNNVGYVSSPYLAELLHIDDSQVRKDVSLLKIKTSGKSGTGYNVSELRSAILTTLGLKQKINSAIVGAGNLGSALAKYDNFLNYGMNVVALFDADKNKVGQFVNDKEIFDVNLISKLSFDMDIRMVILTIPSEFAQGVIDGLINSNIKYIWNFSQSIPKVPPNIEIWNENLIGNFLHFTYKF